MTKRWATHCIRSLVVLSAVAWCTIAQATPIVDNFQSLFRTEGADLDFAFDFSTWDDGGVVGTDAFFSSPSAVFTEFGSFGGGGGSGLGNITVAITRSAGAVGTVSGNFHAFFDLEIDQALNTFFNEHGDIGTLGNGFNPTSFEIDEPGFLFGDIDLNFRDRTLDNTNNIPAGNPDDVAVAFGWNNFLLAPGDTALLTLVISDSGKTVGTEIATIDPLEVFTLQHIDQDSNATITFSGALEITGSSTPSPDPIPEPSSVLLFLIGVSGIGIGIIRQKRKMSR